MIIINDFKRALETSFNTPLTISEGKADISVVRYERARKISFRDDLINVRIFNSVWKDLTVLEFVLEGQPLIAQFTKMTDAEAKAWEREKIDRLVEAGEPIRIQVSDFKSGDIHYVSAKGYLPATLGDKLLVNGSTEVRIQKIQLEPSGDRYLTLVLSDEYRDTYEEWKADQKAKEKAAQAEKNKKIAETRKAAGMLGGKALKGTSKQKAWAEEIRARAIKRVAADVAQKLITDAKYQHSKFWIENRKALEAGNVLSVM